ncbi:MAG: hypothetical protein ABI562_00240 [Chloroflexota bacterium]
MALGSAAGMEGRPAHASPRIIGRVPLTFAVALVAALSLVGPVAAAQPYFTRNIVDGPHVDVIDCGSFNATLSRTFTGTDIFFVDGQDQPLRDQFVGSMAGTLTSSTGTVVKLRGHIHFVFDFVEGTYTFDGQVFMANRPGVGVVIQDTGKYVTDSSEPPIVVFEAGPHNVTDIGAAVFCAALS